MYPPETNIASEKKKQQKHFKHFDFVRKSVGPGTRKREFPNLPPQQKKINKTWSTRWNINPLSFPNELLGILGLLLKVANQIWPNKKHVPGDSANVPLFGDGWKRDLLGKGCKRDLQLRWIYFIKKHPDETHPKVPPKICGGCLQQSLKKPFGAWCLYISPFVKRSAYFCVHLRKKSRMVFVHPESWKLTAFTNVRWISHHMMDSHLWRNPPMMDPMYHQWIPIRDPQMDLSQGFMTFTKHLSRCVSQFQPKDLFWLGACFTPPTCYDQNCSSSFTRKTCHPKHSWMLINKAQPRIFAVSQTQILRHWFFKSTKGYESWQPKECLAFSISSFCP